MLRIAHLSLSSPFILAPLAGYSDLPFRLLCRKWGAGYCVSEMISCQGLTYRQDNTLRLVQTIDQERPVAFQLFGSEPEKMAEAAAVLAEFAPELIDINMGCPVKKVTRKGAGAALMQQPEIARKIVAAIVRKVSIPVTVKIRSGINSNSINAPGFAKSMEDAGAAAITIHARTWAQGFSGTIDPRIISLVKQSVSVPVIGNGDVHSLAEGRSMMAQTGCDGIMIGRAALGNPWVFSGQGRPMELEPVLAEAREHLRLMEKHLRFNNLLGYARNHLCRYFKQLAGSSMMRKAVFATTSMESLRELLASEENLLAHCHF